VKTSATEHWTCRGTHRGEYAGIPPTGKPFQLNGITICRVANGKVVEERGVGDALGMMQQLSVIPHIAGRCGAAAPATLREPAPDVLVRTPEERIREQAACVRWDTGRGKPT
jgi:hypothetical protein